MTVVSFYVNTLEKSPGKLWGHNGIFEKLLTLGSYCPCDNTFLDMYQQVTTHGKFDHELSQITQICINKNLVSINFGLSITLTKPRWEDY